MGRLGQQCVSKFSMRVFKQIIVVGSLATLVACSGGGSDGTGSPSHDRSAKDERDNAVTFPINVEVSGLIQSGLILQNNDGDDLAISSNGAYTFKTLVPSRAKYVVTVKTPPANQACTVINGTGFAVGEIPAISVLCDSIEKTHSIGGTVTGLQQGDTVVLLNNDNESIEIKADGVFRFSTGAVVSSGYRVIVKKPPTNKICTVFKGTGVGVNAPVTDIEVVCSEKRFTVGGVIAGLNVDKLVILLNNSDTNDALFIETNGVFTFLNPVAYDAGYRVTITRQPKGQQCTLTDGTGIGVRKNITTVKITCSANEYAVGGTVSGLNPGQEFTLINNGNFEKYITVKGNSRFAFGEKVAFDGRYEVTVGTQPTGQQCSVTNGAGSGVNADVDNISVLCSVTSFPVGGTIRGLPAGERVILRNNDAEMSRVESDGSFSFKTRLAYGSSYNVSVRSIDQPDSATCTVDNGSGVVTGAVQNIAVVCSANTYRISGSVTGLNAGEQVTLRNKSDYITVKGNQIFTFANPVVHNLRYEVTVGTQPVKQHCIVSNGSGSAMLDVGNVLVTCTDNISKHRISGTVEGLKPGNMVVLRNGGDSLMRYANGPFSFDQLVNEDDTYDVTVGAQPFEQLCEVTNGSSIVKSDVENVTVKCGDDRYTISGTLTGVIPGGQVTLYNNDGDPLIRTSSDTSFKFETPVPRNGSYAVTVGSEPYSQTCAVENGVGTNLKFNVNNVKVTCRPFIPVMLTTMHSFEAPTVLFVKYDTVDPVGLMQASDGHFYGTTKMGGTFASGSIFKMTSTGRVTDLYSFGPNDLYRQTASFPQAGLMEMDSKFYGSTAHGGQQGNGTIYSFTAKGVMTKTFFTAGMNPVAELIHDQDRNLYGTSSGKTMAGISNHNGTIFKMNPQGVLTTLHDFGQYVMGSNPANGASPTGRLVLDKDGYLYGTTQTGGTHNQGTIFKIKPTGEDFTVVHHFNGANGRLPVAGLIQTADGSFYGTTRLGGKNDVGTVFKMTPQGQVITLHSFDTKDGAFLENEVILAKDGNFYGTTQEGGLYGKGTIFAITSEGDFVGVYSFRGKPDGSTPTIRLVEDVDGHLYGATRYGGVYDNGAIFKLERRKLN